MWRYGVEKLRADGHAEVGEVTEKLTGDAKPVVNVERTVYGGVIDQAFPTDCRTRFLEFKVGKCRIVRDEFGVLDKYTDGITSLNDVGPSQQDYAQHATVRRTNKPA